MKVRLLEDKVLVKPTKTDDVTKGGIIIPTIAKERPLEGIIAASGPGSKDYPMAVEVGSKILYGKNSGVNVIIEENDYLIMRQSDILAIL